MQSSFTLKSLSAALCALGLAAGAQAQSLSYIGQQIVPSGTLFNGTTIGGLSGIDRVAATGQYLAISDDRSALNPARFYNLSLDLGQFQRSANPGSAGVTFNAVTTIQSPAGTPFATNTVDPEGLRFDAARGTLVWTNEGQRSAAGFQNPTVREMAVDGSPVRDFAVPNRYAPAGSNAGTAAGDRGVFNNLAFESLSISVDGQRLWTATENALTQDGPAATVANGSPSRFLSFDIASGAAGAEYVYEVSPVALLPVGPGPFSTNGLTDFIEVADRQFITIERSFSTGAVTPGFSPQGTPTGNTIRLYWADARGATDVSSFESIASQPYTPIQKTLLLDLSTLQNDDGSPLALDNIEGITTGPEFNGLPTLLLVSDNNFSGTQFTQFVALSITAPIPEPHTHALLLSGLGAVAWVVRRRRPL